VTTAAWDRVSVPRWLKRCTPSCAKNCCLTTLPLPAAAPKERRLAILGFYGPGDFLRSALTDQEKRWLDQCEAVKPDDLMERHRHNLPEWLVQPLKDQLGDGFWPLVESLNLGAGLDLRVNALKAKRADVQKELQQAGIKAVPTPFSPWGLRIAGKPALNKNEAFLRGDFEVQDEGSQLLGHAGRRQARRNGGGLLRRRRWQDTGAGRRHAQHRAPVRLRHIRASLGRAQAPHGTQRLVQRASCSDCP